MVDGLPYAGRTVHVHGVRTAERGPARAQNHRLLPQPARQRAGPLAGQPVDEDQPFHATVLEVVEVRRQRRSVVDMTDDEPISVDAQGPFDGEQPLDVHLRAVGRDEGAEQFAAYAVELLGGAVGAVAEFLAAATTLAAVSSLTRVLRPPAACRTCPATLRDTPARAATSARRTAARVVGGCPLVTMASKRKR